MSSKIEDYEYSVLSKNWTKVSNGWSYLTSNIDKDNNVTFKTVIISNDEFEQRLKNNIDMCNNNIGISFLHIKELL